MNRKSIPVNVARQLWASCGGYCQNPSCRKYLFASVGDQAVSLANVAHIIGQGNNGPRSEHELADYVEKNGIRNLIMLCLDCHKIVDELESKFPVETLREWKIKHEQQVIQLFDTPCISDERKLLIEISELLDVNGGIFREYGPYSERALNGESGDSLLVWRRRCLDTILPNNRRIINLVEKNKRNFGYPWDVYRAMSDYRLHAEAFEDNCLVGQRVNDYKLFPIDFVHFIRSKLCLAADPLESRNDESLDFRRAGIPSLIERFFANHNLIEQMEQLNIATAIMTLKDGRNLRVFFTNTYHFTDYTFNKVIAIDPTVDVIICSSPYATYDEIAKIQCLENGIGLFMLGEFMGAIRKTGEAFLNYLLNGDRDHRIQEVRKKLEDRFRQRGVSVFLFGSFLRRKIYRDVDVLIVYQNESAKSNMDDSIATLKKLVNFQNKPLDVIVCSSSEYLNLKLNYDNLTEVYRGN